jgi:hypothetical protein
MAAKVKAAIKNRDINGMFNEMCGEGVVPPHISYKKYNELRAALTSLLTLLENFSKGQFSRTYKDYELAMAEILVFCKKSRQEIEKTMPEPPFNEIQLIIPGQIDLPIIESFSNTYKNAKNMELVILCIKTCNALIRYNKNLIKKDETGKNNPDGNFIRSTPGAVFAPLPFTSFNIKEAFIRQDMTEHYRLHLLMILAMTFEYCHTVYNIYTSPDWDPEVFAEVMKANLVEVRKRIPRCDKAFNRIEKSLDLLKDNMGDYYRDFIATKNPSCMLESFVNDVANKNADTDPQTTRQFRQIISTYKKLSGNKITDPRMKALFDQVNNLAGESISVSRGDDTQTVFPDIDE